MSDLDHQVRLAAFAFLDRLRTDDQILARDVLARGFDLAGRRVPLLGPQGIFKPSVCALPLSITTVPVPDDGRRPYDDAIGHDGFLRYRYRGTDPQHRDNEGLREAGRSKTPLIYFHGIVPGRYVADYPVFIVGDDPAALTFTVTVDERRFADLGTIADAAESAETEIRRRYVTRQVQQRLHQAEFRERVLDAYRRHCAVCRLKQEPLLEAAHIIPDRAAHGLPVVTNGISLCTLHHRAFDAHLIAVTTDYHVEIRPDILDETDGPMLIHGLQGFHRQPLRLPRHERHYPDRGALEERYALFRAAAGS